MQKYFSLNCFKKKKIKKSFVLTDAVLMLVKYELVFNMLENQHLGKFVMLDS